MKTNRELAEMLPEADRKNFLWLCKLNGTLDDENDSIHQAILDESPESNWGKENYWYILGKRAESGEFDQHDPKPDPTTEQSSIELLKSLGYIIFKTV